MPGPRLLHLVVLRPITLTEDVSHLSSDHGLGGGDLELDLYVGDRLGGVGVSTNGLHELSLETDHRGLDVVRTLLRHRKPRDAFGICSCADARTTIAPEASRDD